MWPHRPLREEIRILLPLRAFALTVLSNETFGFLRSLAGETAACAGAASVASSSTLFGGSG